MMNLKLLYVLVFFIYCTISVQAQTEDYKFSHVNVNNGLSHNQVKCFLKDSKGFMWISKT